MSVYDPVTNNHYHYDAGNSPVGFAASVMGEGLPLNKQNPSFHPSLRRSGAGGNVSRGFIKQLNSSRTAAYSYSYGPYTLHFLWNPTQIGMGYAFNSSALIPLLQTEEERSVDNFAQGASLQLDIWFDRLWEVWVDKTNPGVMSDIQILEAIMGVGNGTLGTVTTAVDVYFGSGAYGARAPVFRGFITSAFVTYTHFSQDMVPTRCSVSMQFQQTYLPGTMGGQATYGSPTTSTSSTSSSGVSRSTGVTPTARPATRVPSRW